MGSPGLYLGRDTAPPTFGDKYPSTYLLLSVANTDTGSIFKGCAGELMNATVAGVLLRRLDVSNLEVMSRLDQGIIR